MKKTDLQSKLKPVWWELCPGVAVRSYNTLRTRIFGIFSLIFYEDLDGKFNYSWVHTSSLIDRTP